MLPAHEDIEYKITRGSWDTERLDATGALPGNFVLRANGDAVMRHTVVSWRDGA